MDQHGLLRPKNSLRTHAATPHSRPFWAAVQSKVDGKMPYKFGVKWNLSQSAGYYLTSEQKSETNLWNYHCWRETQVQSQRYRYLIMCLFFFFQTLGSWIMLFLCVWDLRCFSLILLLNLKFDEYTCCQRKRIFGLDPQVIRGHRPTNNAKLVPNAGSERIWWTRWALLVISRVITTINGLIHG